MNMKIFLASLERALIKVGIDTKTDIKSQFKIKNH